MKVAFAGTPDFALASLQALHGAGFAIPLVLTRPDRPAGRGLKLQPSPVKAYAQARGLPVAQPRSLKLDGRWPDDAADALQALTRAAPDVLVVAAYGLILPPWVLALPLWGCINVHASLLPRWRGAAPIQRAIEAGDTSTGITIMQMDAGLDTGGILLVRTEPVLTSDTTATLQDRLARLGAAATVLALQEVSAGSLKPQAQPAQGATYAHKVEKREALVDWTLPGALLERRVRAFDPFPGLSFRHGESMLKVWRARVLPARSDPGTVIDIGANRLAVACGEGALELLELQAPGGKRLPADVFLRGHAIPAGTRLMA